MVTPVKLFPHKEVSSHGFLITLKLWMGRLFSTISRVPSNLMHVITKTNRVSQKTLDALDPIHSPFSSTEANIPTEFDTLDTSSSIVLKMFENYGKKENEEIFSDVSLFTLDGKKIAEKKDFSSLTGAFQIEWKINEESSEKLMYRGTLENGTFHGKGCFSLQDQKDGTIKIILEGRFEKGEFKQGLLVMDHYYIEGSFPNGKLDGEGLIHFFDGKEYRGNFVNAIPHGTGKMVNLSKDLGVILSSSGEYQEGILVKGEYVDTDGNILSGEWDLQEGIFRGKLINYRAQILYEGERLDELYHGKGKLIHYSSFNSQKLIHDNGKPQFVPLVGEVQCTEEGEFRDNILSQGTCKLLWEDGKSGIITIENGIAVKCVINDNQHTYEGDFELGTLDGTGTIFKSGTKVYEGRIKAGVPHGDGCTFSSNGTFVKGTFEYGELRKKHP